VVCTIHQPSPKIFALFDNLILMKKGNIVYQGNTLKVVRFLDQLKMPCPPEENLADHLLTIISPANEDGDKVDAHNLTVPVDLEFGLEKDGFTERATKSWFNQFSVLFQRNLHQYIRRLDIILMSFVVTVIMATFIGGGIWYQIGDGQDSVATRTPSLFFCCVNQGIIGALQMINSFPGERAIMLRERAAGAYTISSYFLAKTAVDFLTQLWTPILFSCIVYWMIGYQPLPGKFFIFMMFMILNGAAATSVAAAVSCLCVSVELSTVALSMILELSRLYGGFFTSPAQLDDFPEWKWLDVMSYLKYAFVGVALNELHGLQLSCDDDGANCQTAESITKAKGYDQYTIGFCAGILVVYIVVTRVIGYLGLKFIKG
jgi:ATP-binding cassette subfamily G (WHITE) protein 2